MTRHPRHRTVAEHPSLRQPVADQRECQREQSGEDEPIDPQPLLPATRTPRANPRHRGTHEQRRRHQIGNLTLMAGNQLQGEDVKAGQTGCQAQEGVTDRRQPGALRSLITCAGSLQHHLCQHLDDELQNDFTRQLQDDFYDDFPHDNRKGCATSTDSANYKILRIFNPDPRSNITETLVGAIPPAGDV